jgi:hypothetical protein
MTYLHSNWVHFNKKGTVTWKYFFYYEHFLEAYTREVIRRGVEQNIFWQEWRTTFLGKPVVVTKVNGKWTQFVEDDGVIEYLKIVQRAINKERETQKLFKGAVIIWCVTREYEREDSINKGQVARLLHIRGKVDDESGEYLFRRLISGKNIFFTS